MKRIVYAPEVVEDLSDLIELLVQEEYLSYYEDAEQYVRDILTFFRENIGLYPAKSAPQIFLRYGLELRYIPYKRNNRTTWYIIFAQYDDIYHVVSITNNHVAAQYF